MPISRDEAYPSHVVSFFANTDQALALVAAYDLLCKHYPRSRRKLEVTKKSAIVLLVASWEAYIEDLAVAAFDALLAAAKTPEIIPAKVLAVAARGLRDSQDERSLWALAGNGWRTVLEQHRDTVLDRFIGKLNTPKPEQVNALFDSLIGLPDLSSRWVWPGTSATMARERVLRLVELRGSIAHRVQTSAPVHRSLVVQSCDLLTRLAARSSEHVRGFIQRRTGSYPWNHVKLL